MRKLIKTIKGEGTMNNQTQTNKVSAQDMMTAVLSANKAAVVASRNSEMTNKSVIELTKKVNAMQSSLTQDKKPRQNVQTSKGATALLILLMILGIAVAVAQFVPQVTEYLSFITPVAFQWTNIGYAVLTVIVAAVAKVKRPIRFFAVIFAIGPMVANLVLSLI